MLHTMEKEARAADKTKYEQAEKEHAEQVKLLDNFTVLRGDKYVRVKGARDVPVGADDTVPAKREGAKPGARRLSPDYEDRVTLKHRFMEWLFGGKLGVMYESAREAATTKGVYKLLRLFPSFVRRLER